jgi:hypothetical protein
MIHHAQDADHDTPHEAADGLCRVQSHSTGIKAPPVIALLLLPALIEVMALSAATIEPASVHRQRGTAPPRLIRSWQFLVRAALPSRAPSLVA